MAKDTLRLDKAVSHNFDVPRSYAAKLIKAGDVEVDGEVITEPAAKISIEADIVIDVVEHHLVVALDDGVAVVFVVGSLTKLGAERIACFVILFFCLILFAVEFS